MRRLDAVLIGALALLLGASVWVRAANLVAYPEVDGDEAWRAVQYTKMLQGRRFELSTVHGQPLSPIAAVFEIPFLVASKPDLLTLRVPAFLVGLLSIGLTYLLGTRMFGRPAGVIAATLVAVLPLATIFARTGYESSNAPIYSLLLIYCAHRLRIVAMTALLLCVYFVHPTNMFLHPVLVGIVAVQSYRRSRESGSPIWGPLLARTALVTAVVLAVGLYTVLRPVIGKLASHYGAGLHGEHDPGRYLVRLGHLFLGLGDKADPRMGLAFWSTLAVLAVVGTHRLIRLRRWDSLALVAGTVASAAGLFVMGGSNIIQPGMTRYGLFLMMPTILGVSCLAASLIPAPGARRAAVVRPLQFATMILLGWYLLLSCPPSRLTGQRVLRIDAPGQQPEPTRPATAVHPMVQAIERVAGEIERERSSGGLQQGPRSRERPSLIVTEGVDGPLLEYLALAHPNLRVCEYEQLGPDFDRRNARLRDVMRKGAFAVGVPGGNLEFVLESSLPSFGLRRWAIDRGPKILLTVYRADLALADDIPVAADYDGDGRADPTVLGFEASHWTARLSGGGSIDWSADFGRLGVPAMADYDGDGRVDPSLYDPTNGGWFLHRSKDGDGSVSWGPAYCIPVPGDYDGDGKDEPALYVMSSSTWFLARGVPGPFGFGRGSVYGGRPIPAPADYDGDGKTDVAVFDSRNARWMVRRSLDGDTEVDFGSPGQRPAPADFDGDRRADLATFDAESGTWRIRPSSGADEWTAQLGPPRSVPVPGDYDGDGRADLAAFDPKTREWHLRRSTSPALAERFGPIDADVARQAAAVGGSTRSR